MVLQISPSNSKYRSRDMPAVRTLFPMMSRPTSAYFGMTTGPGDARLAEHDEPVVRSRVKPSASKTRTSVRQSVGASRLMRHERERDVNHVPIFLGLRLHRLRLESAVLQHSIQGAARETGLDEELQCLGEVVESDLFAGALAVDVERRAEGHEVALVLSHLRGNGQLEPDSAHHVSAPRRMGEG